MSKPTNLHRSGLLLVIVGAGMLFWALTGLVIESHAAPIVPETPLFNADDDPQRLSNEYCMLCHAKPNRVWTLPNQDTLSLTIDPSVLEKSVHGSANPEGALACADCHVDYRFPHPVQTVRTAREFTLSRYAACRGCHEDEYRHNQDSVHGAALRSGRTEAAVCVDCHGAHDIQPPAEPRERISLTCGKCHGAIFEQYRSSVHGTALLAESNPDVPTCINCHGVHNIQNPTTPLFRVRSPELCAKCHADQDLMAKYNISTQVFDSYLTDFHGSTVALFEQQDPEVPTNKAVCYDCHGVHDIQGVNRGEAQPIREKLLAVCQQCHPGAEPNFPDAWIGHYPVEGGEHPTLTAANGLYRLLVPFSVGILGLLIATDLFRRIRRLLGRDR